MYSHLDVQYKYSVLYMHIQVHEGTPNWYATLKALADELGRSNIRSPFERHHDIEVTPNQQFSPIGKAWTLTKTTNADIGQQRRKTVIDWQSICLS